MTIFIVRINCKNELSVAWIYASLLQLASTFY